ncbi:unnamed protein product [Kuraishia capsulata CBS 1993]|uniref:Uncharacterized protein n=1 Tax=Kuraishia capsulata CBS 1993 TaxID=1382522 RepID=W6MH14_9ASCO|nr:uncharacterized protein KUCA_T00001188001 [Kuraishia capsulata CBS 1993]CDK25221.1 unnamed protein product [Kuraishia capsulata CBS 1993]
MVANISLKGKTAIVTGGTKNLGAQTAEELASYGANLLLHYHSESEKANGEKLVNSLSSKYGVKVVLFQGDLSDEKTTASLFETVKEAFGSYDIAINNAGMVLKKPLAEISLSEYDKMFSINTRASFLFLRGVANTINEDGNVVMLVTSLLAAYTPYYSIYQAAKAAVEHMVKGLSKELQSKGISVNAVAPGPMDTPFLYGQETPEAIEYLKSAGGKGRLTKVEDIVPIVRFLVTEGGWISGQTIFANGGFTAR